MLGSLARAVFGRHEVRKIKYQGRVISCYSRCRIHSLVDFVVYDGIAKDTESGMKMESRHHKTGQDAIEHALRKLKELLRDKGIVSIENEKPPL